MEAGISELRTNCLRVAMWKYASVAGESPHPRPSEL